MNLLVVTYSLGKSEALLSVRVSTFCNVPTMTKQSSAQDAFSSIHASSYKEDTLSSLQSLPVEFHV